jgi:hypothetical protein
MMPSYKISLDHFNLNFWFLNTRFFLHSQLPTASVSIRMYKFYLKLYLFIKTIFMQEKEEYYLCKVSFLTCIPFV